MGRIQNLFKNKNKNILNVYFTAGYPHLDSTIIVMRALQENGVDMIELGIPYSDPLADGPVIQGSSNVALKNGMSIKKLFEQLQEFRTEIKIPVILMGYMNPVLQYGFEKFCSHASNAGIDGLIIPDLPYYEYEHEYRNVMVDNDLDFIFLVTPESSEQRVRMLDKLSSGFLYAVSSSSTTGSEKNMTAVTDYLQRLQGYQLKNPVLVGFGIKDKNTFNTACSFANGAIIGSAFINSLGSKGKIETITRKFLTSIKN